jgi:protein-L-isoaspartate(D-aspartate) O-methyltransferase
MIPDWPEERREMIERQLVRRGIHDPRVLDAIRAIPREEFVPPEHRFSSYLDEPVPIGYGQTLSQPYMTALMAELLELTGRETVLEIGAGSGYAAAVLGRLAARVVAIELIPALAAVAESNLARAAAAGNITVICGDGSRGHPALAPYDAISVAAAAPEVPPALVDQLAPRGRLVIPVGQRDDQELLLIQKRENGTDSHVASYCRFVPLRGEQGWK